MLAVGHVTTGHSGRRFSWWWAQGDLLPAGLLSAGRAGADNGMGLMLSVQVQDGSSLMLTARSPQRSPRRQDAVGKHPGTSFGDAPLVITARHGPVPADPRARDGCHLPMAARRPGRLKRD